MLRRYDLFARDYEIYNPVNPKAVDWYLKHVSDPVLELAFGTGRLMMALAKAGFHVDGIDLSEAMHQIAEKNISTLSSAEKERIRRHKMDMTNFKFDAQFGTVILADNSICELKTPEMQKACLKSVWNSLRPSGNFLITIRYHKPNEFGPEPKETRWTEPFVDPHTGNKVRRKVRTWLSEDLKIRRGAIIYEMTDKDNLTEIQSCPFETPHLAPDEYKKLFAEAGFRTKIFADYEEKPFNEDCQMICFICEKI
ncbi:hypothetical protein TRIP_C90359 [Candidatus Zixiibacteriota bacterium]|nr:hypothetical protein TRIP_C90359 [candidate division Zixibacteria bacterium]